MIAATALAVTLKLAMMATQVQMTRLLLQQPIALMITVMKTVTIRVVPLLITILQVIQTHAPSLLKSLSPGSKT